MPAISHIVQNTPSRALSGSRPPASSRSSSVHNHLHGPLRVKTHIGLIVGVGNPDIAVLKTENQNPTHVTPLIASLAKGYVNEELVVIGPPPKKINEVAEEQRRRHALGVIWKLIERVRWGLLEVDWKKEDKVNARSNYLKKAWVGGEIYKVSSLP